MNYLRQRIQLTLLPLPLDFKKMENAPELDQLGVLSGKPENLTQTDAEAFPDEPEEYMPHERVKIVVDNTNKKKP